MTGEKKKKHQCELYSTYPDYEHLNLYYPRTSTPKLDKIIRLLRNSGQHEYTPYKNKHTHT